MSNQWRLWAPIAILLCLYLVPAAAAQERQIFEIGGGTTFSTSFNGKKDRSISHGHAYFVPEEPGFVFGCVDDANKQMTLNYLLLIKHKATPTTTFERGDPDPATSSASSDGKIRFYNFKERIRFDERIVSFSYKAEFDAVKDTLISEGMTVEGKKLDLRDGRVFVFDMTAEPVTFAQVSVKLPTNENLDFIKSPSEYQPNMNRWLAELSKTSEVVAKTFKK